jgi:hypothetical protein
MPKSHPPYAPEFRRQMVELVRAGRSPDVQRSVGRATNVLSLAYTLEPATRGCPAATGVSAPAIDNCLCYVAG